MGPLRLALQVALYELPLPSGGLWIEDGDLVLAVEVGDYLNDPLFGVSAVVPLPGGLARALKGRGG